MNIKTQIRRTVASLAAIASFSFIALVQGEMIAPPGPMTVFAAVCPEATAVEVPAVAVRLGAPLRVDWRVRVPATIARSRS